MNRPPPSSGDWPDPASDREPASGSSGAPSSLRPGRDPASVPPPTPLALPVRRSERPDAPDAAVSELDLDAAGGIESGARWESPPGADVDDLEYDEAFERQLSRESELSVVFGGLGRGEAEGAGNPARQPEPLSRALPARPRSVPPPPPSKRLQPFAPLSWDAADDSELPTQTASSIPAPPVTTASHGPGAAGSFLPPPPPVPQLPNPSPAPSPSLVGPPPPPPPLLEDDDEEEVVTRIMGPPSEAPARSLAPISRAATVPAALRNNRWPTRWLATTPAPWLALAAAAVGGLLVALVSWIASPEQGELVVDVSNQTCGVVEDVKIFVDDELVCEQSPCRITTDADSHVVRAVAAGYGELAPNAVSVQPGSVTLHKLQLGPREDTGVRVASPVSDLVLSVDGKEIGPLPQTVTGLSAGEHRIRVDGNDRYLPEERTIEVELGQLLEIDDLQPDPRPAILKIERSEQLKSARVKLDGERVELPLHRELDPNRRYRLTVRREGYLPYDEWIDFRNGDLERVLDIELQPEPEASEAASPSPAPRRAARRSAASRSSKAARATLNLNSIPATTVLLDGRPLGRTPKVGVSVSPGTHSVVFMHPERGRKRGSATLKAGETKTVVVRFD